MYGEIKQESQHIVQSEQQTLQGETNLNGIKDLFYDE